MKIQQSAAFQELVDAAMKQLNLFVADVTSNHILHLLLGIDKIMLQRYRSVKSLIKEIKESYKQ